MTGSIFFGTSGRRWYPVGGSNSYEVKRCARCGEYTLIRPGRRYCSLRCANMRDSAGYRAQHTRVAASRGRASSCVFCGTVPGSRYEWAYNEIGSRYDIWAYISMCAQCHDNYEAGVRGRPTGHGIVRTYRQGCRCEACRLAKAASR